MNMNLATFASAVKLHSEGLRFFQSRNYDEAIKRFSESLLQIKEILPMRKKRTQHSSDDRIANASPALFFLLNESEDGKMPEAYCHASFMNHSSSFIFKCPVMLDCDSTERPSCKLSESLSYIILYNLALSNHLRATENGILSEARLKRALRLYEFAYHVQTKEQISLNNMQTMALVNNIGHIHRVLKNEEEASQCFQHLLSVIMYVVGDCGERESNDHLDGFLANVMPLILQQSPSASAA